MSEPELDGDAEDATEEFKEVVQLVEQSLLHIGALQKRIAVLELREWQVWPKASEQMGSWVNEWLVPTFRLEATLSHKWDDDPAIVSELAALFAGYLQMISKDASGWDPLTWHSHKTSTVERITAHQKRTAAAAPSVKGWGASTSPVPPIAGAR